MFYDHRADIRMIDEWISNADKRSYPTPSIEIQEALERLDANLSTLRKYQTSMLALVPNRIYQNQLMLVEISEAKDSDYHWRNTNMNGWSKYQFAVPNKYVTIRFLSSPGSDGHDVSIDYYPFIWLDLHRNHLPKSARSRNHETIQLNSIVMFSITDSAPGIGQVTAIYPMQGVYYVELKRIVNLQPTQQLIYHVPLNNCALADQVIVDRIILEKLAA